MTEPFFKIPYYHEFLSPELAKHLLSKATDVEGVAGLRELGECGGLESKEALRFLVELYETLEPRLAQVLLQRTMDRKFIDDRVRAASQVHLKLELGLEDGKGRVVFGPESVHYAEAGGAQIAPLPEYLKGPHVTLFGPPDSAKMAINAMNAYHRRLPSEPAIVEELLSGLETSPFWGADDEDSKTPLRSDLVSAAENLSACFDEDICIEENGKKYQLAQDHLSLPIKRFPGLALPSTFLFYRDQPIPLHLYDFALHFYKSWQNPRSLVFYVPKLENEEEAQYIHSMVETAEKLLQKRNPSYVVGTVRLMIVLENPRAILRAHEIIDSLYPYFAGASLGWHDYLASTARLFKEDPSYRIPVKADPHIVIKHIKASHDLLAQVVGSRGGIKVGGMYGILPTPGDTRSFQVTLLGFFKDVVIQLKRGLTGFWVAHPDFVRLGLATWAAWKKYELGEKEPLEKLVSSLLEPKYQSELMQFISAPDIAGLKTSDADFARSLIVADIEESDFIPNHHPDEVRYNVFQSLQYLTDWLCGNGCVALPTEVLGTPVRVMDDLATAERSRWEVWAEVRHGRFSYDALVRIAHEEMNFIRRDLSGSVGYENKRVQVKWDERTSKWYPVALQLMLKLMTDKNPPEFATELLLPFTILEVREASDPWKKVNELAPRKYRLEESASAFHHYFEACGSRRFATLMAENPIEDFKIAQDCILSFSVAEIKEAAHFHGDIGQSTITLDSTAAKEQARVVSGEASIQKELLDRGSEYLKKFGFKFLISAHGKSGSEILTELKRRMGESLENEVSAARQALWQITHRRLSTHPRNSSLKVIEEARVREKVSGLSIAINTPENTQCITLGEAIRGHEKVTSDSLFQIASLSKTVASSFAIEYFLQKNISLDTPVNSLFEMTPSSFRLNCSKNPDWAKEVKIRNLLDHSALGLHYVNGFPRTQKMPTVAELLRGEHGYEVTEVLDQPGREFHYSGGGYLVLEHLIEALEQKTIQEIIQPYLKKLELESFTFHPREKSAHGYFDETSEVPGGSLQFPAFAAGGWSTASDIARYLSKMTTAFHSLDGVPGFSHDTAVLMLHAQDRGCMQFMGCRMGLGVFVADAGENRFAIHQGANEGFRALYLQCYSGPDRGKGFVILANGDNPAVSLVAQVAQELIRTLGLTGVDTSRFKNELSIRSLPQEQIVNLGYKKLVFDAFIPDLPEGIARTGALDPLAAYNRVVGSSILSVTDQKFALAENLISSYEPVFDPELFCRQGKVMDSWESVRHNPLGVDTLVLELKKSTLVRYISLSTKFHDGNHPEAVRLEGLNSKNVWSEILPKTKLSGHSLFRQELKKSDEMYSKIRIEMFPDGGLTRLGLYSELPESELKKYSFTPSSTRYSEVIPKSSKPLSIPYKKFEKFTNLTLVSASDEHYGPAIQVISPFPPIHMFDGLESARSRKPGHFEEVVLRLKKPGPIQSIVFDFSFFVNNNPDAVSVEAQVADQWVEVVEKTRVKAFAGNQKEFKLKTKEFISEIRVRTYPDGGINRIRVIQ